MMNNNTNHSDFIYKNSLLESTLQLLEFASLLGLLFCGLVLAHGTMGIQVQQIVVYALWFFVSMISVHLMQRGDARGAYLLGLATLLVTIFDIGLGYASLGGAILGIMVAGLVIAYLRYIRNAY